MIQSANTIRDAMNQGLAAICAHHGCTCDPITLHPGSPILLATHVHKNGARGHLQLQIDPIGSFDPHATLARLESKLRILLGVMQKGTVQ